MSRFDYLGEIKEGIQLYSAIVNSVRLKRNIRVVCILNQKSKKKRKYTLLFSTDITLSALLIYKYYKARFQQEFLFRDAKQFTGLSDCQARCAESLDFHFNASMSALNLAKIEAAQSSPHEEATPFSMGSRKRLYLNEYMIEQVGQMLALELSWLKTHPDDERVRTQGVISP